MKQFRIVLISALAVLGCKSNAQKEPTPGSAALQGSAAGSGSGSGSGSAVAAGSGSGSSAGSGSAVDSGTLPADVADFQQRVRAVAKADGSVIAAWGTRPMFVSKEKVNGPDCKPQPPAAAASVAGNVAMLSSAERQTVSYIFEVADHKLVAMTVPIDGRTVLPEAFDPDAKSGTDPAWATSKDVLFHHQQNHRGGYESIDLMVNGDQLVVAKHEALEDVRDSDKPKQASFLVDNSCACNACPALDGFKHGLELSLTTPGTAAAPTAPTPSPAPAAK